MSEMVKRVARALCQSMGYHPEQLEAGDALGIDGRLRNGDPAHFLWREYVEHAQDAIRAMREPTPPMIWAANRMNHPRDEEVWRTMIDEALTSPALPDVAVRE